MPEVNLTYVQLEPGQALLVTTKKSDLGARYPDLFEEIRTVARKSAKNMVDALGGSLEDHDALDGNFGKSFEKLGERLHQARFPVEVVQRTAYETYIKETRHNISPELAIDLSGLLVDKLSYSVR